MRLSTSDIRIRLAGLFKNCPAAVPDFRKKADRDYRTFPKKFIRGADDYKISPVRLPDIYIKVRAAS